MVQTLTNANEVRLSYLDPSLFLRQGLAIVM